MLTEREQKIDDIVRTWFSGNVHKMRWCLKSNYVNKHHLDWIQTIWGSTYGEQA